MFDECKDGLTKNELEKNNYDVDTNERHAHNSLNRKNERDDLVLH